MNTDSFIIVMQARMGSSRLPGKVLMDFCGMPMLLFQINLIKIFNLGYKIVVATSTKKENDEIEKLCLLNKIKCFRGIEENVFERFRAISKKYLYENIIRLTADNPLPNYGIIREAIELHQKANADLTTTRTIKDETIISYTNKGQTVDIIRSESILKINQKDLNVFDREHVIPYFFKIPHKICYVRRDHEPNVSYSIDTEEDLQRITHLVNDKMRHNTLLSWLEFPH